MEDKSSFSETFRKFIKAQSLLFRDNIKANYQILTHHFRGRKVTPPSSTTSPLEVVSPPLSTPSPVHALASGASAVISPAEGGKMYYDEQEMDKKFEAFVYDNVRNVEYKDRTSDGQVHKLCSMIPR